MTEKRKVGRPSLALNANQIKEMETLAAVLNHEQIADYFGMHPDTLAKHKARDKEINIAYKKGRAKALASIASSLLQSARSGNITAQIFYLKTQGGWKETTDLNVEVTQRNHEISFINAPDIIEHDKSE